MKVNHQKTMVLYQEKHQQIHLLFQSNHQLARQQPIHPCFGPVKRTRGTCWFPFPDGALFLFLLLVDHLKKFIHIKILYYTEKSINNPFIMFNAQVIHLKVIRLSTKIASQTNYTNDQKFKHLVERPKLLILATLVITSVIQVGSKSVPYCTFLTSIT